MSEVHFFPPTERKFSKAEESFNKHILDADRGSEGKWQSLVENLPAIIMTVTGDGTITFINNIMPGLTSTQAIGTKVYEYIPVNHRETLRKSLERVFQTGETVSYETSGIGSHDTASWCVSCVGPVWLGAEVVAAILVAIDMTVRNRVEMEAQRKSHDLGERIKELNCLYKASQMMAERDITRDEVLNRLIELIPSACQFPEITCTRIILYGREFKSENFKKTKWKLSVDITLSGSKIGSMEVYYLEEKPEADEGPFYKEEKNLLENIARETEKFIERRQVDEALHESEAKYRSLIEQSNDAIYLLYDGRFEVANRRFTEMLGISSEETRTPDFNLMDYVAPRSRFLIEERRQMLERGKFPPPYYEFYGLDKEGREFAVEASVKYIPYRDGTATQGILRDISERRKLEEQLRQAIKMEAIGRLAGGVAHDFNNLLTVITGYAELALISLNSRDQLSEDLQEIQNAADRASGLTRQLLAFSRKQTQQSKVLNLNDIITELHKMLRRIIGEDIHLETIPEPDLWSVNADPGQIEQIIVNLAVNARDAMPDGGKLTIETQNVELDEEYVSTHTGVIPGSYVMLAISDTGCGMTEETKSQIFDPFFTTKKEGEGTGLGLSTVYGIVKQSGGNIWIYSELEKGTTFKIYLPMVSEKAEKFSLSEDIYEMPRGTETVLVVEDEDGVRRLACRVLKQQGYTVLEARTGEDAYLMCHKHEKPVDLVLTDVIMPNMGGAELVEKLRELWQDFKVLYMSGYTANTIAHRCVLDQDEPYLQKPFRPIDIAWKVRRVLDGK